MLTEIVRYIKGVYGTPSAESIALRELEEAKRRLLEAQKVKEYADSMCHCYETRINRLTAHLRNAHDATPINLEISDE